ncbi:hypothetical protein EVAR_14636_1 [Eumeta japonica]|uniref:Uncharacterized protein n=1 Tax=Eumeta variegata TaxID=151549 RepID=A0A4C1U2M0_EUMVA|nr:hypothetical protein EVAR_14636_1 [Eumeta japonica]
MACSAHISTVLVRLYHRAPIQKQKGTSPSVKNSAKSMSDHAHYRVPKPLLQRNALESDSLEAAICVGRQKRSSIVGPETLFAIPAKWSGLCRHAPTAAPSNEAGPRSRLWLLFAQRPITSHRYGAILQADG